MNIVQNQLLSIVKLALGKQTVPKDLLTDTIVWREILTEAENQSLEGIVYAGLLSYREKTADLACATPVDTRTLLIWYGQYEYIRALGSEANNNCAIVSSSFDLANFDSCLLKGQGLSLLYPPTLSRSQGDIDIWVMPRIQPQLRLDKRRRYIYDYCKSKLSTCRGVYHHVEFPVCGLDIEVHYTPSWLFSPIKNRKLQRYFESQWDKRVLTDKGFYVPSYEMNLVFVICHIYSHLMHEGIGLRQIIDYYYLLKSSAPTVETQDSRINAMKVLDNLGMKKITSAVMWILSSQFDLDDNLLLCSPNESEGQFVLNEIMKGGNMGKHYDYVKSRSNNLFMIGIQNFCHNTRLMTHYPSETLWAPWWKIWHYFWCMIHGFGKW